MVDREINIEHEQIQKKNIYILTDDENYHGTQHIKSCFFFVFSCADI